MHSKHSQDSSPHITIIGLGLIGGSLAMALRAADDYHPHITAFDSDSTARAHAMDNKIIDNAPGSLDAAVKDADMVILCIPPAAIAETLTTIAPYLKPGCIVSDVCSVKQSVVESAKAYLPDNIRFIPAHPIAGKAESGIEHAEAKLFRNAKVILTPDNEHADGAHEIYRMWQHIGAVSQYISADSHDRLYAYVSHLPQAISFAMLRAMPELVAKWKISTDNNLREFARLTNSDRNLWADIFLHNRRYVNEALSEYIIRIDNFIIADNRQPIPYVIAVALKETVESMDDKIDGVVRCTNYAGSGYASITAPLASHGGNPTRDDSTPHIRKLLEELRELRTLL